MQLEFDLFPSNRCGRSAAPCALTRHSSAIICELCGCVAPVPAVSLTSAST
jgi:hypothetical protein